MRADPIPKPPPKLGISHATREERECFTLFQQHDGRKRKTKDIPGWSPIPPIECRDGPDEACNETSETKQGEKPKQNAFDRIMTADQRRRSKKRSSKAVGNQDAEFDQTEFASRYWLDESLPVLSRPEEIFGDIVRRFPEISDLASKMERPLRVATMCSGTEAPLLALELVSRACEVQKESPLAVTHVFSSEVEPFKQAYIERNFAPPLLFRDVRELGSRQAHTAFGSLENVPRQRGDVDILVAGTSCVDYSNLNTCKKTLEQLGESGQTFYGMFEWVQRARPPLVLLENVCGAPWKGMIRNFEAINYRAQAVRLDTKNYYLPQTRTRGYLLAIADEVALPDVIHRWERQLRAMERNASASLEAFMLDAHDPRVQAAREDLSYKKKDKEDTPWDKCEARHARVRIEEKLGQKRPLTNWVHGVNAASLPDFAWRDWAGAQTERVLDSMDIDYMRLVKRREDANFKTSVWDLSQNVDRSDPTKAKLGICPCLTPSLCAYVTNQGRPVVGVETLALQGIPIDDLLLTRETEENLTSLSGNAMSTTVVGSALLAALLSLPMGVLGRIGIVDSKACPRHLDTNYPVQHHSTRGSDRHANVVRSQVLVREPLELGATIPKYFQGAGSFAERVLHAASQSAKRCVCEAQRTNSSSKVLYCTACGHSACEACAGKPEHTQYKVDCRGRVSPEEFEVALGLALPTIVTLSGLSTASLCKLRPETAGLSRNLPASKKRKSEMGAIAQTALDDEVWRRWVEIVSHLDRASFRLVEMRRCVECWKVRYTDASSALVLELTLGGVYGIVWHAFVEPPRGRGPLRDRLEGFAVLRGFVESTGDSLLDANWSLRLPIDDDIDLELSYDGPVVESFASSFGMEDENMIGKQRYSHINVKVLKGASYLDEDVSGRRQQRLCFPLTCPTTSAPLSLHSIHSDGLNSPAITLCCAGYVLLHKCAAPLGSLHKRLGNDRPELYLFLESKPVGPAALDTYVFARDWRRLALREARSSLVCSLQRGWHPLECTKDKANVTEIKTSTIWGRWVPISADISQVNAAAYTEQVQTAISVNVSSPWNASSILEIAVDLGDLCATSVSPVWGGASTVHPEQWKSLTLRVVGACGAVASASKMALGFLVPRLKLPVALSVWQTVQGGSRLAAKVRAGLPCCTTCAPLAPTLSWVKVAGKSNQFTAIEDPYLAGEYERALKNRPAAFELDSKREKQQNADIGFLRIAINPVAIAVRAFSALPRFLQARADGEGKVQLDFRIVSSNFGRTMLPARSFSLCSNRVDEQAPQTPGFGNAASALRPEQLRSLTWMQRMEATCEPFIEEEVVDEALSVLGWRAEARVQIPVVVRGGVLADAVGYGKTAITLALIDAQWRDQAPELPPHLLGKAIPCKATLVIVPKHLMAQWPSELRKFLGDRYKCLTIMSVGDLMRLTIPKVLDAEIIIMSVQTFRSKAYFDHLAEFAAVHAFPSKGGRYFEEVHSRALQNIEKYVSAFQASGQAGLDSMRKADKKSLRVTLAVNTSKKQAYESGVPLRGARESKVAQRKKSSPSVVEYFSSDDSEQEEKAFVKPRVESVRTKRPGPKAPPLEMFYFARKVVDEYTYLDHRDVPTVQAIKARCSWVLSGTPPLESFDDVKGIAAYLGVHLGASNPVVLTKKGDRPTDSRKELSKSELFQEFLEAKSQSWHARRQDVAQRFLDRFVRQNVAEIDEIRFQATIQRVVMPAPDRAVYLELEHHLHALEMQKVKAAARGKKKFRDKSDRETRLSEALEGSADAEEALLKRCARPASAPNTIMNGSSGDGSDVTACSNVVSKRAAELENCATQIVREVAAAHRVEEEIRRWAAVSMSRPLNGDRGCDNIFKKHGNSMWQVDGEKNARGRTKKKDKPGKPFDKFTGHQHMREWWNELNQGIGDSDASAQLLALAAEGLAIASHSLKGESHEFASGIVRSPEVRRLAAQTRPEIIKATRCVDLVFPEPIIEGESAPVRKQRDDTLKELFWALRNQVYELRALNKEYVGRTRSLRFFRAIEQAQREFVASQPFSSSDQATNVQIPLTNRAIFSCCGHVGETSKMRAAAAREECPAAGCHANVRSHSVVECASLCLNETNSNAKAVTHHGAKLAEIIDLVSGFPKDERVLIFVQFEDLLTQVHAVLNKEGFPALKLKGTAHQMSAIMSKFQKAKLGKNDERILLLELHNESASGANLTAANHVIFVHPLHVRCTVFP